MEPGQSLRGGGTTYGRSLPRQRQLGAEEIQYHSCHVDAGGQCSIGDVVELVELLCLAILLTPREGGKNRGKILDTVGELLGATIRTRFEDESRCQCLRACRSAREGICFAVSVGQE